MSALLRFFDIKFLFNYCNNNISLYHFFAFILYISRGRVLYCV